MRNAWLLCVLTACGTFGVDLEGQPDAGEPPAAPSDAGPVVVDAGRDATTEDAAVDAGPDVVAVPLMACQAPPSGTLFCDDFATGAPTWGYSVTPNNAAQSGAVLLTADEGFVRGRTEIHPNDAGLALVSGLYTRLPGITLGPEPVEFSFALGVETLGGLISGVMNVNLGADSFVLLIQPAGPNATEAPIVLSHSVRSPDAGPAVNVNAGTARPGETQRRGLTLARQADGKVRVTPVGPDVPSDAGHDFTPSSTSSVDAVQIGLSTYVPTIWNVTLDDALLRKVE